MSRVLTLFKSLEVLEAIVSSSNGIGTRALAQQLSLNVASVHNIATTFTEKGYIRQDPITRLFFPGIRLMHMGQRASSKNFLASTAQSVIRKTSLTLNESVLLVSTDQGHFTTLAAFHTDQPTARTEPQPTNTDNVHATACGKILLAHADPQFVRFYISNGLPARTASTITTAEALLADLERVRSRGHSTTRNEYHDGISAIAIPVRDAWGEVFAALGVSTQTDRMDSPGHADAILQTLRSTARKIEKLWSNPASYPPQDTPPGNRRGRPRKQPATGENKSVTGKTAANKSAANKPATGATKTVPQTVTKTVTKKPQAVAGKTKAAISRTKTADKKQEAASSGKTVAKTKVARSGAGGRKGKSGSQR